MLCLIYISSRFIGDTNRALRLPTMNFNIFNTFILSGVLQGFIFFAAVISNKQYKNRANTFLALTVLFLSISNLNYYFLDIWLVLKFPHLIFLHIPWALTLAPSFYYYVKHSVEPVESAKAPGGPLLLYLPFIIISLAMWGIRLYTLLLDKPNILKPFFYFGLELVNLTAILISAVASYKLLNRFRMAQKKMPERYIIKLDWLRKMLILCSVIIGCWVVLIIIDMTSDNNEQDLFYPLWLSLTLWIYWVGYTGIYQAKLAKDRSKIRQELKGLPVSPKVKESQKNGSKELTYYNTIIELLRTDRIYTNPSLGLQDIADELAISPNYISKIVNAQAGMSFTDLVNQHRHVLVKEMLQDPQFSGYKIMAIALEAGFNSKSNFYKYFKSVEGVTPTDYRKKLQESS